MLRILSSHCSGREVVQLLLTKPILTKRLFAQDELLRSKTLSDTSEHFSITALATAAAAIVLTTPPLERKTTKHFCTFSSREPNSNGLPLFNEVTFFIGDDDDDDDDDDDGNLTIRWYFSSIALTVLSVCL